MKFNNAFDKKHLMASFSNAAKSYDEVAKLQKIVGELLLNVLNDVVAKHETIIDLGCGTGYFTAKLNTIGYEILGIDIAEGMCAYANKKYPHIPFLCADAHALPLKNNCCGVLFSNLMLQWCFNYKYLFSEIIRILQQDGVFVFSTFGEGSFKEIKQCWQAAHGKTYLPEFIDMGILRKLLKEFDFKECVYYKKTFSFFYEDIRTLLRELKAIGAHNHHQRRNQALMGKNQFQNFLQAYEVLRNEDHKLPVSYEIIIGVFKK